MLALLTRGASLNSQAAIQVWFLQCAVSDTQTWSASDPCWTVGAAHAPSFGHLFYVADFEDAYLQKPWTLIRV